MAGSLEFEFFMSQIRYQKDIKETDKTKISVVYHEGRNISCILRVCKGRDLSAVCEALKNNKNANTLVIYDYVYENGDTYVLEENLDGQTVEERMEETGCLSEDYTARVIVDVCNALEGLHRLRPPIVHNDINPSNIMIREDGSVKLMDFDISRLYRSVQSQNTTLFGTEEYASPEHFGYGQSEPRTDIYCLGVTMHKMLTNRGLTSEHRITYKGKLKTVINKCLEFDPKNRYQSVSELRKGLERFLSRKKRLVNYMLAAIAICAAVFGGIMIRNIWGQMINGTPPDTIGTGTVQTDGAENEMNASESQESTTEGTTVNDPVNTTIGNDSTSQEPVSLSMNRQYTINKDATGERTSWEEWYRFTTAEDLASYTFTFTFEEYSHMITSKKLQLCDASKTVLLAQETVAESLEVSSVLEPGCEYWLRVSGNAPQSYTINTLQQEPDAGISRENALPIELNTTYYKSVEISNGADWFRIDTTDCCAVYRFYIRFGNGPYSPALMLYDQDGIKIEEIVVYPDLNPEGFLDIYLDKDTEYAIKVTAAQPVDYELCVFEKVCDAGTDRESATQIMLADRNSGTIDSTLSDWYAFTAAESGRYKITCHNINAGAPIKCYAHKTDDKKYIGEAENEDNCWNVIAADQGEQIFIEILSLRMEANGQYILIVEKE